MANISDGPLVQYYQDTSSFREYENQYQQYQQLNNWNGIAANATVYTQISPGLAEWDTNIYAPIVTIGRQVGISEERRQWLLKQLQAKIEEAKANEESKV